MNAAHLHLSAQLDYDIPIREMQSRKVGLKSFVQEEHVHLSRQEQKMEMNDSRPYEGFAFEDVDP